MESVTGITVIILTFNEERHIARCIESVADVAERIFVVDSHSTDRTCEIAASLGAEVYRNPWVNHAVQFNWALKELPIDTPWIFRLDADETADEELRESLRSLQRKVGSEVAGVQVKRKMIFLGRWINHGAMYPVRILRIFRRRQGASEMRWMDEHIKVSGGSTIELPGNLVDDNRNTLGWWIVKHNGYATREAIDLLSRRHGFGDEDGIEPSLTGTQAQRKRWLKVRYAKLPLFVRPFLYFLYRYLFRLGFLDGWAGLVWHFLQGFWYRFLVDAKLLEIRRNCGDNRGKIVGFLREEYGIDLAPSHREP